VWRSKTKLPGIVTIIFASSLCVKQLESQAWVAANQLVSDLLFVIVKKPSNSSISV
jgi:hypothetical protein